MIMVDGIVLDERLGSVLREIDLLMLAYTGRDCLSIARKLGNHPIVVDDRMDLTR